MWIAFQGLLNKKRQTREPGSHIRVSRHKPNPHAAWDRDHLRPKTSSTRPSASASTLASTRTRLPSPRSISIMPAFRPADRTGGSGVCAKGAGNTLDGKGGDAASWTGIRRGTAGIAIPSTLASFRQAKISPRETPCLRATSETFAPAVKLSSMIRAFSSSDQRRRRSTPFKISTGTGVYPILRTSLRSHLHRSTNTDKAVKIGCIRLFQRGRNFCKEGVVGRGGAQGVEFGVDRRLI